jgi:hypothetical protein
MPSGSRRILTKTKKQVHVSQADEEIEDVGENNTMEADGFLGDEDLQLEDKSECPERLATVSL